MAREVITLACTECGNRNYTTKKNKRAAQVVWSETNIADLTDGIQYIKKLDKNQGIGVWNTKIVF